MTNWIDPDDAPKLDRTWFAEADLRQGDKVIRDGRPRSETANKSGTGWQTRMIEALRKVAGL